MERMGRKAGLCLVSVIALGLGACGGGGNNGGGGGGNQTTTPTVTITPAKTSITTADSLTVTVAVTGAGSTPTGSVTVSAGTYTSSATTLSSGSASVTIPAGAMSTGTASIRASYTPDSGSSSKYNSASGTGSVAVTLAVPTVTVTPASNSIASSQSLNVAVTVSYSGGAVPTGTVTLASGSYTSAAAALTSGSASISIPSGSLATGNATLTVTYSPDTASTGIYGSATGSGNVTVTNQITPTVAVTPASQSLSTSSPLNVTVKVTGSGATPTGFVVLSSGAYASTATTLSGGSATITVPAYSLGYGSNTLSAAYTPDAGSAGAYNSATGTASVSVARATPSATVTPASFNIDTTQSLNVKVSVAGPGTGPPVPTGTISLSGGGYMSPSPVALSAGSASITIAAGALASGSDTLTASYTPDSGSATIYNSTTGASAAIAVVTMSTVSVAQGTSIGAVTDQLMGMNLAAWYDVVGNATSINAAFAQAGIKAIRWPGGSWSDAWHWRTSSTNLIPYMCNTAGSGTGWGGYSSFFDFVTALPKAGNYDLALTANYGSNPACNGGGDPTEAAGWAAEAVSEGYPPSHMTVGNEEYGSWEYDLHAKKNDATTYANAVIGANGYYTLIKAASPTTQVGVVVDAGSIQPGVWDSTVLSVAKNSYDFLEFHWYPANPGQENDTYLVHTAAQDLTTAIQKLKSEMTTAGVNVPIYVGEMGSVSSNPGKQSWSITQGLYAGQTLGEMMNDGVARATWWIGFGNCNGTTAGNNSSSLYGWQTFGAYNIFSDGPGETACPGAGPIGTMSPTAQAFNLFQNLAVSGESVLSAPVTGDTTNIRAYAATHSGGTALFLFNLNENQSQPVTIKLSKQSASSDVTVITYDKSIYDQTHAATPVWAGPKTTDLGAQTSFPLVLTLTPWSMNVVIIK